jgi:hypothetical protein
MSIDEKIQAAYDALTAGRPGISDGQLTISNICLEAGISRASFYRSPLAATIRRNLADPGAAKRPETEQLRAKVHELTAADKQLRTKHATEIRDLRATVRAYANQVQILALRAGQLEDDNKRLTARLQRAGDNVTPLNRALPERLVAVRHLPRAALHEMRHATGPDTLTDHITAGHLSPAARISRVLVRICPSGTKQ